MSIYHLWFTLGYQMLLKVIFQTTRPSFLILTPICIALAVSTALLTSSYVNLTEVALILMAGLMAHVSVNAINEYADFKSGLDLLTEKTPFSGGSGALPSHPKAAFAVLIVGISSIVITSLIGLYFLWQKGLALLPLGLMGVFLVVSYTHWLNRMPLLCLIAPGLGLGVVMVIGSHWVLVGEFSNINIFLALVPFFYSIICFF